MNSIDLKKLRADQPILLKNHTCPYCGAVLELENATKEHVIGRKFVPKGSLNKSWNLIVRACSVCNGEKSKLENDISAITLASRIWFDPKGLDKKARKEARRKMKKCISSKTGKPIIESQENIVFTVPLSYGISLKGDFKAAPQLDSKRVFNLARLQLMAFFYLITFNEESSKGGFWQEGFHPLSHVGYDDWANSLQVGFAAEVKNWDIRWLGTSKYYKSVIRRHPEADCWSWALEWNLSHRVVGFFGSRTPAQEITNRLIPQKQTEFKINKNSLLRLAEEKKLSDDEDILFNI